MIVFRTDNELLRALSRKFKELKADMDWGDKAGNTSLSVPRSKPRSKAFDVLAMVNLVTYRMGLVSAVHCERGNERIIVAGSIAPLKAFVDWWEAFAHRATYVIYTSETPDRVVALMADCLVQELHKPHCGWFADLLIHRPVDCVLSRQYAERALYKSGLLTLPMQCKTTLLRPYSYRNPQRKEALKVLTRGPTKRKQRKK